MKRILMIFGALVLLAGFIVGVAGLASAWSVKRDITWRGTAHSLDELVDGWAAMPQVPGAILVIRKGDETVYAHAAGTVTKEGGAAVTPDTPFRTASVGKLFTAATVLRLYEQGRLDIDAPAADHLGEELLRGQVVVDGVDYWDRFTIRQLLNHHAGVGSVDSNPIGMARLLYQPWRRRTPVELVRVGKTLPAAGPPGGQYAYSSTGYNMLGLIVESVTGEPFYKTVRAEVIDRLGMTSTFETLHEWSGAPEALHPYIGWFDMALYDPSFEYADGGYVTTAADLGTFGVALARGEVFDDPATTELMLSPPAGDHDPASYQALGPYVEVTPGGARLAAHTGFWGVYCGVYPDDETVAVFTVAQLNAQIWDFWDTTKELGAEEGYLPE